MHTYTKIDKEILNTVCANMCYTISQPRMFDDV